MVTGWVPLPGESGKGGKRINMNLVEKTLEWVFRIKE